MSDCFTLNAGHIVAEVRLHRNGVWGAGRADWPVLSVTLDMAFRSPEHGNWLSFRELRCRVSAFESGHIAFSLPKRLQIRVGPGKEIPHEMVFLEIPIDRNRIAWINRKREGGDVNLRLDLELEADELVELGKSNERLSSSVFGLKENHRMLAQFPIHISRSSWVEGILVNTEFSKVHLLELPAIPIEQTSSLKASFDALQHAVKLEKQGFYNDAIAQCRKALEPFWESVEKPDDEGSKRKVLALKSCWETKLGKATFSWLDASMRAVKQAANDPHHLSSKDFGQLEAQMLLTVTTALIAYAVKTQPDPKTP